MPTASQYEFRDYLNASTFRRAYNSLKPYVKRTSAASSKERAELEMRGNLSSPNSAASVRAERVLSTDAADKPSRIHTTPTSPCKSPFIHRAPHRRQGGERCWAGPHRDSPKAGTPTAGAIRDPGTRLRSQLLLGAQVKVIETKIRSLPLRRRRTQAPFLAPHTRLPTALLTLPRSHPWKSAWSPRLSQCHSQHRLLPRGTAEAPHKRCRQVQAAPRGNTMGPKARPFAPGRQRRDVAAPAGLRAVVAGVQDRPGTALPESRGAATDQAWPSPCARCPRPQAARAACSAWRRHAHCARGRAYVTGSGRRQRQPQPGPDTPCRALRPPARASPARPCLPTSTTPLLSSARRGAPTPAPPADPGVTRTYVRTFRVARRVPTPRPGNRGSGGWRLWCRKGE